MPTATISSPFIEGRPPEWASGYGQDEFGYFAELSVPTGPQYWEFVTQRMRWIPAGTFMMGSPPSEVDRRENEAQHEVTLTRGYWLADTACTQELWKAVTPENPSEFPGDDLPVERVSFEAVQSFLARLSERVPGACFTLPTEAQWEYACRAGTETPISFGQTINTNQVNYDGNYPYAGGSKGEYRKKTVAVKSLPANPWGLYQMHGNVWEWCSDWYADYSLETLVDPVGPKLGSLRVLRGGGWSYGARYVRSACRFRYDPAIRERGLGFRLLSSASPGPPEAEENRRT